MQYLNNFYMVFLCNSHEQKRCKINLSNDILYIFVSFILSKILLKKRRLFTLIISIVQGRRFIRKKIHPSLYFPVFRANTSHGESYYTTTPSTFLYIFICIYFTTNVLQSSLLTLVAIWVPKLQYVKYTFLSAWMSA